MKTVAPTAVLLFVCVLGVVHAQQLAAGPGAQAFHVVDGLFDTSQPDTLGLAAHPETETLSVFKPGKHDNRFNHGAVVARFKGKLYVQWQTSKRDEDAPDTHIVYSTSPDGQGWTRPRQLTQSPPGAMTTSGGWWVHDDELIAFINVWPSAGEIAKGGYTLFSSTKNGVDWTIPAPVTDRDGAPVRGIFEQDPRALADGRIISAFHLQPGLIATPFYTDDPRATSGWTRGRFQNLPFEGDVSREIEPSWFAREDGALVMVFRDQAESFRKLASVSHDRGESWSTPALTDMPDARTKQSAGNLPDGTAYLVGNPVSSKARYPLVLALSSDGREFDRAWLLRAGGEAMPAMRFEGRYKRPGYSYPKSAVIDGWLYVAHATNKEDIELTRVPAGSLYPHEM